MAKLVIVESPAKAKTIKKYLGSDYKVIASMGHVRDLPKSKLGVDIENGFEPNYITIRGKGDLIKKLTADAKGCSKIYLATDPDREGEAISWHLSHILGLKNTDANRVTFNEITKTAVNAGIKQARPVDLQLVDAYQARRVLDRIVGYKLSAFLWKKVKKGLSAGRVQSVATRIIVEREREINAFVPEEFWDIDVRLKKDTHHAEFVARFFGDQKKKIAINNAQEAKKICDVLENSHYKVDNIKVSLKKKAPMPPFITSTLQQEASRRYNFPVKKTMQVAQNLYEGIDVEGYGTVGLITYMRTDSLRISDEARGFAKDYIISSFGSKYYPETPRVYKTKASAQDAHEAIRPSVIDLSPIKAKSSLSNDQYKIYKLIWERFIASQMESATLEVTNVDILSANYILKASETKTKFDGYMCVYKEKSEDEDEKKDKKTAKLPPLEEGDKLIKLELLSEQNFTQPPSRYTEATLIRALEEKGIGRPSTYAPTISTIMNRMYAVKESKFLVPTNLGMITTDLMKDCFSDIVDYDFTASMEDHFDNISDGKEQWRDVIRDFYGDFDQSLSQAEIKLEGVDVRVADEVTDIPCDKCGTNMVIKSGKFGRFLACPRYPECKNTKAIVVEANGFCPKCSGKMIVKQSKKGKKYYSCEHNPSCEFMTWDLPQKDNCPVCGGTLFKQTIPPFKTRCLKDDCEYEKAK